MPIKASASDGREVLAMWEFMGRAVVLTRQEGVGTWGVATYALNKTDDGPEEHRGHRGHQADGDVAEGANCPMPPMPPMPLPIPQRAEALRWRGRI